MEVNTRESEQDVAPENALHFPQGLPGFESLTRFKLFHENEEPSVFLLQSLDEPEVEFPVADPALFHVQYQITLTDAESAVLQLEQEEDVAVLVLLYRDQSAARETGAPGPIHANFLGPVLINTKTRIGLQKVLNQVEGFVTIAAS